MFEQQRDAEAELDGANGLDEALEQVDSPSDEAGPESSEVDDYEIKETIDKGFSTTRRGINRLLALAGIYFLGRGITDVEAHEEKQYHDLVDEKFERIIKEVDNKYPDLSERERAMKLIDAGGVIIFGLGVASIVAKKHINSYHYGALLALTAAKYYYSDQEGKAHLKGEIASNAKAFGIIAGCVTAAEGINAEVETTFEAEYHKKPDKHEQVALMTMMASALSPALTTVTSAGVLKKMSSKVAEGNKKMMATCVSHISNLSGYLLFGDPPFIAICEKLGFWKGMLWQMKNMWPLAMYSLYSATYKLNLELLKQEGVTGNDAKAIAKQKTAEGFRTNIPVLTKILSKSARNFVSYFRFENEKQDVRGLEFKIGEVIAEKLENFARLTWDPELGHPPSVPPSASEAELESMVPNEPDIVEPQSEHPLHEAMGKVISLEQHRKVKKEGSEDVKSRLSIERIKEAAGENLGDVINIFPFQAGCVPFLTPVFKDLAKSLEGMNEHQRDMVLFLLIMVFSMFADNYVACKIGLEILPEKPQIALIAAIQGGSMTAIGNMSNVTQFNLEQFSLSDSFKTLFSHANNVAVGLAYAKAIGLLEKAGILGTLVGLGGGLATAVSFLKKQVPSKDQEKTRREALTFWRKKAENADEIEDVA